MKPKHSRHLLGVAIATAIAGTASPVLAQEPPMEEVIVYGQFGMMKNAIERQRDSDVLQNVITRDSIGQFPDQNVAEAVRRLPGINVLNDQGEGRFIAVRGLDPTLNGASVNGTRIPAPESDTRQVALDVIPSELIESIEIKKTLTPDMDADTIGASIQINTTSALDREGSFVTARVESAYTDLNSESSPKVSVDFTHRLSDNIGIAGGFSYNDRDFSTDNVESEGWDITDGGILFADTVEYRDYDVNRKRIGGSLTLDVIASESTTLFARVLHSKFDDTEQRRRLVLEFDEEPASGSATSATFLSDDGEIKVERELKDRFEGQTIETYEFGGESIFGAWNVDYKISLARAEEVENKTEDPTLFAASFEDPGQLAVTFDYGNMTLPAYSVGTGAATFNEASTYEFDTLELVNGVAEDEELALQLDVTRAFAVDNGDLSIKFGGKLRQREKSFDLYLEVYDGFDGDYTLADVTGSQSYGLIDINPLPDLAAVRSFNAANNSLFELSQIDTDVESALEDFRVDEDILAGYVMGRWETERLLLIGGVRVERTENDMVGNLVELVEEGGTRGGVVLDDDTVFVTERAFDTSYTDVLPSVALRYNLAEDMIFRGGIFRSVVRPNIGQLAPRFAVEEADDGEREGEFGNPALDPYGAWNFDATVEWYFAPQAVLQGGFFYKDIQDFIVGVEFGADDAPYNGSFNGVAFDEAVIPLNGDDASVAGFEFGYQQALESGFILGLNYTYTDAEGEIGGRTIPLPAAAETTYNAMLGYERGPVSLRLTAAYRDSYLDELGGDPEEDRYVEDHLQWDLTARYTINDNFQIYGKLVNINDEPYVAFQPGPGSNRLLQYEEYSWTGVLGIQATF